MPVLGVFERLTLDEIWSENISKVGGKSSLITLQASFVRVELNLNFLFNLHLF